jgi:hypothetical protein
MACTGSVSYGMMPACAGYTTVNKKPKAGLASTRVRSVLMVCHALNWQGTSMDSAFIPLSSIAQHSNVCCASSMSYGKKKAKSINISSRKFDEVRLADIGENMEPILFKGQERLVSGKRHPLVFYFSPEYFYQVQFWGIRRDRYDRQPLLLPSGQYCP